MKVAWKVESGDRRTKLNLGPGWINTTKGLRVKCLVWSWTAWGILPHNRIEGCVVPQTFILWDRRVLECEMLQSLKLSNINCVSSRMGDRNGSVSEYAVLPFNRTRVHVRWALDFSTDQVGWIPHGCIDVFRRETRFRSGKVLTCQKNKLVWTSM
jgi:hypothetical protein